MLGPFPSFFLYPTAKLKIFNRRLGNLLTILPKLIVISQWDLDLSIVIFCRLYWSFSRKEGDRIVLFTKAFCPQMFLSTLWRWMLCRLSLLWSDSQLFPLTVINFLEKLAFFQSNALQLITLHIINCLLDNVSML